jgi:hypothetical protein
VRGYGFFPEPEEKKSHDRKIRFFFRGLWGAVKMDNYSSNFSKIVGKKTAGSDWKHGWFK